MTAFEELIPGETQASTAPAIELVRDIGGAGLEGVELEVDVAKEPNADSPASSRAQKFIKRCTGLSDIELSQPQAEVLGDFVSRVYAMRSSASAANRQSQVLSLNVRGLSQDAIAVELGVPQYTVSNDLNTAMNYLPRIGLPKSAVARIAHDFLSGQDPEELFAPYFIPEPQEIKAARGRQAPDVVPANPARNPVPTRAPNKTRSVDFEGEPADLGEDDENDDALPAAVLGHIALSTDNVGDYLRQIGKAPLLNAEQEVDLAKRIEAGLYAQEKLRAGGEIDAKFRKELQLIERDGQKAYGIMLESNLRLAVSLAKRYTGRGMLFADLIQEGNMGLIRAVQKFDYAKGYKFSTYATWWIRQAISRAMADNARTIRIPVHMVEVINRVYRMQRQFLQEQGHEATIEQIADAMGMTPEKVIEVQKYGRDPISIHAPVGTDGDSEFGDLIEDADAVVPENAVSNAMMHDEIREVLDALDERESGVITRRFGLYDGRVWTLEEISKEYGVTRERIRQIESKTLVKLRHPSRSKRLTGLLD